MFCIYFYCQPIIYAYILPYIFRQGLGMPFHLSDSNKGERRPAATSTIYHYVSVWYSEQQSAHRDILRLFIHTLSRCPGNQQPVWNQSSPFLGIIGFILSAASMHPLITSPALRLSRPSTKCKSRGAGSYRSPFKWLIAQSLLSKVRHTWPRPAQCGRGTNVGKYWGAWEWSDDKNSKSLTKTALLYILPLHFAICEERRLNL